MAPRTSIYFHHDARKLVYAWIGTLETAAGPGAVRIGSDVISRLSDAASPLSVSPATRILGTCDTQTGRICRTCAAVGVFGRACTGVFWVCTCGTRTRDDWGKKHGSQPWDGKGRESEFEGRVVRPLMPHMAGPMLRGCRYVLGKCRSPNLTSLDHVMAHHGIARTTTITYASPRFRDSSLQQTPLDPQPVVRD